MALLGVGSEGSQKAGETKVTAKVREKLAWVGRVVQEELTKAGKMPRLGSDSDGSDGSGPPG